MVQSFEFSKGRKVRLWIDELPPPPINDVLFIKAHTLVLGTCSGSTTKMAMELSLQKHNSSYGLLGVELIPVCNQDYLEIKVCYSTKNTNIFNETLAYNKSTVFSTLPEEYAETILKRSVDFARNHPSFPTGQLIITTGAHCEVGSSKALFGIITDILLSLLVLNKSKYDDNEIETLLVKLSCPDC